MSVSDPLIKEIKGCTSKFLQKLSQNECITDHNSDLHPFCAAVEKIFTFGLGRTQNSLGFTKCMEPWLWMRQLGSISDPSIPFVYKNAIDQVEHVRSVHSNVGRFRLLVRHCLSFRCLHVPVEYVVNNKNRERLYTDSSIIGDEILSQILLSVLLQCSKISFRLELFNASFLDVSWRIPHVLQLELVPCESLGLGVSFADGKAVIMNLVPNSVITENGQVRVGDILDNLNGVHICCATKGRLRSILQSNRKKPVSVTVIKAFEEGSHEFYPPIVKLLKAVGLDPITLKNKLLDKDKGNPNSAVVSARKSSAGFKVTYIGYVEVGRQGDMKQIDKSAKILLSPFRNISYDYNVKSKKFKTDVFFEIGEIGLKIVDFTNSELLFKHSYMEISSCGSVFSLPNYFAYIAGDEYCNTASNFICYIFHSKNFETIYTILQSIGQGFHRTHFAV